MKPDFARTVKLSDWQNIFIQKFRFDVDVPVMLCIRDYSYNFNDLARYTNVEAGAFFMVI